MPWEYENKSILLRRQVANNVKLFEKSKEALTNQYRKRQIFMNDELSKLRERVEKQREELTSELYAEKTRLEAEHERMEAEQSKAVEDAREETERLRTALEDE